MLCSSPMPVAFRSSTSGVPDKDRTPRSAQYWKQYVKALVAKGGWMAETRVKMKAIRRAQQDTNGKLSYIYLLLAKAAVDEKRRRADADRRQQQEQRQSGA